MRLWLSRQADVPIREQLTKQITLAILSGELQPAAKLPSTRELARRYKVHANTISAAYSELVDSGWLEQRRGSGVYVRERRPTVRKGESHIDDLIAEFLQSARRQGFTRAQLLERLHHWLAAGAPERFVLIESDPSLSAIALHELAGVTNLPVSAFDLTTGTPFPADAVGLVFASKADKARKHIPPNVELITLHVQPIAGSLEKWLPLPGDLLIGIATGWGEFRDSARTMLLSAGMQEDALVMCDTAERKWQSRLSATAAVVCDTLTAKAIPPERRPIAFTLLSDASRAAVRDCERRIRESAQSSAVTPQEVSQPAPKQKRKASSVSLK